MKQNFADLVYCSVQNLNRAAKRHLEHHALHFQGVQSVCVAQMRRLVLR